jgi:hypothetical protein
MTVAQTITILWHANNVIHYLPAYTAEHPKRQVRSLRIVQKSSTVDISLTRKEGISNHSLLLILTQFLSPGSEKKKV